MVHAVSALSDGLSAPNNWRGRRSPNLDAQLATCRAQLADWVTCPSARTPEGKEKIERITTRLDAIKQQIKQADEAAARRSSIRLAASKTSEYAASPIAEDASRSSSGGDSAQASTHGPRGSGMWPRGAGLDLYA